MIGLSDKSHTELHASSYICTYINNSKGGNVKHIVNTYASYALINGIAESVVLLNEMLCHCIADTMKPHEKSVHNKYFITDTEHFS